MSRTLDQLKKNIKKSKSNISFTKDHPKDGWFRYFEINGEKIFSIGLQCETCQYIFKKINDVRLNVEPEEVVKKLNNGLTHIDKESLDSISEIIPDDQYIVLLLKIKPLLVEPNTEDDYFSKDITKSWIQTETTNTNYYRGTDKSMSEEDKIFEFLIPLTETETLDMSRVNYYKNLIKLGKKPTALSIGTLDIRVPVDYEFVDEEEEFKNHWCLSHYIIDGHHKLYAASELNESITILCFLQYSEYYSNKMKAIESYFKGGI